MASTTKPSLGVLLDRFCSLARPLVAIGLTVLTISQSHTILKRAYSFRLHAIENYGFVIHEFDPYFNFRAAQYLYDYGWTAFVKWFDYKVWYPLGRPVGTTIYPGMQVTAVWLTKCWLPIWFGLLEWLKIMKPPSNVIVKSATEVASALSSSSSSMSMIASIMASMGMKWNEMNLNDVCCLLPAWFGALATFMTGLIALECSSDFRYDYWGSRFGTVLDGLPLIGNYIAIFAMYIRSWLVRILGMDITSSSSSLSPGSSFQTTSLFSMLSTMFFMSIVPAHLMRSVGGGYDNESVAVTAMTSVFYMWTRSLRGVPSTGLEDNKRDTGFELSLRTKTAAAFGALTGVIYFYMAASWGGYVFVINLVGAHAATLILLGRHSSKLHAAYSAFYVVGTVLATQVPVIGLTPLRSLEQLGPMLAFLGMQLVEYCERVGTRDKLNKKQLWTLRFRVMGLAGVALIGIVVILWPTGFFGPISSRVRGLFVKHTKTGNPLVDSVAEHQAANPGAYVQYLQVVAKLAPFGFGLVAIGFCNDASSFLLVYGIAAYFFSSKMVRLILLTAPIGSVLGGMLVGRIAGSCVEGICGWRIDLFKEFRFIKDNVGIAKVDPKVFDTRDGAKKGKMRSKNDADSPAKTSQPAVIIFKTCVRGAWCMVVYFLYNRSQSHIKDFQKACNEMAVGMSHPTILFKSRQQDGREVLIDDYREAYLWLGANTEEDARIMAWWDYGYQITAISNRTTIADGNTWNHEHIALLGRALTSRLVEGHRIARHMADYVLLWAGGGGDDMAKSPHLRRIANSVYRTLCPGDPTCSEFGAPGGRPSQVMAESLLFRLHSNGLVPGVDVDKNRFKEVYKSEHGLVRIYKILSVSKESKDWVLNNRVCDAPGSWFCPGKYPPGLQKVLNEKRDFAQLEDFNRDVSDEDYQKEYFKNLNDPERAQRRAEIKAKKEREKNAIDAPAGPLTKEKIKDINKIENWADNDALSTLYKLISDNDSDQLGLILQQQPAIAHMRSKDGRGPMFWAHEHGRTMLIKILKSHGVSEKLRDKEGMTALDLSSSGEL